jgi:hypothetical protein
MTSDVWRGALLFAPLFVGLACHGLCIRFRLLRGLTRPIDRGAMWRGARLFGDNKTYRGIVAVALGSGLGFLLFGRSAASLQLPPMKIPAGIVTFAFGAAFGAAAMLSELPNSALKRQLGVGPGEQASGMRRAAFHVLDQVDVLIGGWLILAAVVTPTMGLVLGSFLFVYVGHQLITLAGYALGMRATSR